MHAPINTHTKTNTRIQAYKQIPKQTATSTRKHNDKYKQNTQTRTKPKQMCTKKTLTQSHTSTHMHNHYNIQAHIYTLTNTHQTHIPIHRHSKSLTHSNTRNDAVRSPKFKNKQAHCFKLRNKRFQ